MQERDATRLRITTLQRQIAQALAQIGSYQARVEAAPLVEQELSSLVQDYELERERYEDLSAQHQKRAGRPKTSPGSRAASASSCSTRHRCRRGPTALTSLKLMLMALGLGFMLGAAAVVGREFLDRSVHDARVLQSEFEVPVLGEIPRIHAV